MPDVSDRTVPYEILIRFDDEGDVQGAHYVGERQRTGWREGLSKPGSPRGHPTRPSLREVHPPRKGEGRRRRAFPRSARAPP